MSQVKSYAPIQARLNWFRLAEAHGVQWACWRLGISRKTFYKRQSRDLTAGRNPYSLLDHPHRPQRSPRQLPERIVQRILSIRQES